MLVVHGIWAYGALQVSAADSALPARAAAVTGRPSRAPRPHPFAAPSHVIADALAAALSAGPLADVAADLVRKAIDEELTLRLPSTPLGPLASPELLRPLAAESPVAESPVAESPRLPSHAANRRISGPDGRGAGPRRAAARAGRPPAAGRLAGAEPELRPRRRGGAASRARRARAAADNAPASWWPVTWRWRARSATSPP